jgi:hypothetical protein
VKIDFTRSGGVAGVILAASLETADLAADDAIGLGRLLEELPRLPAREGQGADQFSYRLEVDVGGRRQAWTFSESQVPPELRPALSRLAQLAVAARRR